MKNKYNYQNLFEILTNLAKAHSLVKTVNGGDFAQKENSNELEYPYLFIGYNDIQILERTKRYSFTLTCVMDSDIINGEAINNESQQIQKLSICDEILTDIVIYFRTLNLSNIKVDYNNLISTPFTSGFLVGGVGMEIILNLEVPYSLQCGDDIIKGFVLPTING